MFSRTTKFFLFKVKRSHSPIAKKMATMLCFLGWMQIIK